MLFQFVSLVIKVTFKNKKTCEVVTFPLVSWVRCGACLYRFMIFALFLTFLILLFCNGRFNLPHMPKSIGAAFVLRYIISISVIQKMQGIFGGVACSTVLVEDHVP